jgi:assimilatory nitrate reductase catalytic subunit
VPVGAAAGRTRLHEGSAFSTPSGRAHVTAVKSVQTADRPDARFPLRLTTGRLRTQWHGMSRTGTVAQLFAHTLEPALSPHTRTTSCGVACARAICRTSSRVAAD